MFLSTLNLSGQPCSSSPSGLLGESSIGFCLHRLITGSLVVREAGEPASSLILLLNCLEQATSPARKSKLCK